MKRLAIGIALGLVAAPFTACDKGEDNKVVAPGDKRDGDTLNDGDKRNDGDMLNRGRDENAVAVATVADGMKYIPDGANLLVGMDAAKVTSSGVMKDNRYLLTQSDAGDMLAAADACKVGMSTWKYAVVGGNTDRDKEVVMVFSATGIGRRDTLDCIGEKVTEKNPQERFDVGEEDGRVVVSGGGDGQKTYAVSDDVIAVVGADSQEAFKDLLDGKGKTALDGSLKDVLASVDQSKDIYGGMVATAEMQEGPNANLKYLTGTVDLSAGVAITVLGEYIDTVTATELAAAANKQFGEMKGMAGMLGIPAGVVESVKIESRGAAITFSASAAGDDLEQLSAMIKTQLAGPADDAAPDQQLN